MVIATRWLPFSLALPWLLPRWRHALRAREPRVWLPLGWALLVLAFFSASPGKRDMYILPMLPMVALAAAPFLPQVQQSCWLRRLALALALVLPQQGRCYDWAISLSQSSICPFRRCG